MLKYHLPSKLGEVIKGTNIQGVTPLFLALCKALERQRWISRVLVLTELITWQGRRGRHKINWNSTVITALPEKGWKCQGPKSRKWVMLGKGEARSPGCRGATSGHPEQGHRANWDPECDVLGARTGCWVGIPAGCKPEKEGRGQIMKAFVIYERSLRDSFSWRKNSITFVL